MASLYAISSVLVISLISLIGVFTLSLNKKLLNRILFLIISLAVGSFFGGAFIHLIPEAFEIFGLGLTVPLMILSGILFFFAVEKFLHWHHCHDTECQDTPKTLAEMNLIGDGVHNFLDGLIIGASFLVSIPIGVATSIAVLLHEIPQEISDFGVLLYGGFKVKKALLFNFLSALLALVGVILALVVGPQVEGLANYILPFAAGGFIYIAGSDLIPEIRKEVSLKKSLAQFFVILFGILLMYLLTLLEV